MQLAQNSLAAAENPFSDAVTASPATPSSDVAPDTTSAIWLAQKFQLQKIAASDGASLLSVNDTDHFRRLDLDPGRNLVWVFAKDRVRAYHFSGDLVRDIPLSLAPGFHSSRRVSLRVNTVNGSVWLGLHRQLLHLAPDGTVLQDLKLRGKIEALAFDERSQQIWVALKNCIFVFEDDGTRVRSGVALPKDAQVRALDIDSEMGQLWIADRKNGVRRYDLQTKKVLFRLTTLKGLTRVRHAGDGGAWLASQNRLIRLDATGKVVTDLRPFAREKERVDGDKDDKHNDDDGSDSNTYGHGRGKSDIKAMGVDVADQSVWVASEHRLEHVLVDGTKRLSKCIKGGHIEDFALYRDTLAPELEFIAPQAGAILHTATPALELHYLDQGVGVDTESLTIEANGKPLPVSCTFANETASCTPQTSLPEGANTLRATIRDLMQNRSAPATVNFSILLNRPPQITSTPVTTATATQAYTYDVEAIDPDVGDVLTYSLPTAPAGMGINLSTGLIDWTPGAGQVGDHNVIVRVTDGGGLFATQTFTITVVAPPPVNQAPTITSTPVTSATVNQPYSYDVDATDPDAGDVLVYSLPVTAPAGMTIDAATGLIEWTPTVAQVGNHDVTVRVQDAGGLFAAQSFVVAVADQNHAPTITSAPTVSQWTQLTPNGTPPSPRAYYSETSSYDAVNDRLILFGGSENDAGPRYLNEVWVLANASGLIGTPEWIKLAPTGGPPAARIYHPVVYDPTANRLIVSGGAGGNPQPLFGDTWVLTNANGLGGTPEWIALPSTDALAGHAGGYDPVSNRLVLFGGFTGTGDTSAVRVLKDANGIGNPEWIALAPLGTPPPPRGEVSSATYDPLSNRLIVFGGSATTTNVFNDVWVLSNANGLGGAPEWTQLTPTGAPPPARVGHTLTYDPNSSRLMVFGGSLGASAVPVAFLNDSWVLTNANGVGGTPEWKQLNPLDAIPLGRNLSSAGYNGAANRLIVAMGRNDGLPAPGFLNDAWVLSNASGNCTAGQSCNYDVDATDPDAGDTLTYSLTQAPSGMTIDATTGQITWTPAPAQTGDHSVTVSASDNGGLTATQSFMLTVAPVAVPNVVGLAPEWAEQLFAAAGLVPGTSTHSGGDITLRFDSLPSAQAWTYKNSTATDRNPRVTVPETQVFSLAGGMLHQDSRGINTPAYYNLFDVVDVRLPFSLSMRARVTADDGNPAPNPYGFAAEVWTISEANNLGLSTAFIGHGPDEIGFDNRSFHDYRMTGATGRGFTLVIDGAELLTSAINPISPNERVGLILVGRAAGSGGAGAEADVATFSFTQPRVTTQNPSAGTLVPNNSNVDLTIQDGPATQTVPDIVGQTQPQAEAAILGAQLTVGAVTFAPSDTVPKDHVISQLPLAGIHVAKDSIVSFILSTGPPNRAPTITSTPVTTATVGQPYTYAVEATDPNPGDTLTYTLMTQPAGMSINASTGLIEWIPSAGQVGSQQVTVEVQDQGGLFATQSFTVTVVKPNAAPEITSTPVTSATVNQPYSYDVDATDPDAGDVLVYSLAVTAPADMIIDPATGLIEWTPTAEQVGIQQVTVKVQDPGGLFATQSFTVTVVKPNAAPEITSTPVTSATVNQPYSYDVDATDPDAGDVLVYSLAVTAPADMIIDPATGLIEWTPTADQVGAHSITVKVTDHGGLSAEQSFVVAVADQNHAPTITSTAPTVGVLGQVYTYQVTATDPDPGDVLTFSLPLVPRVSHFYNRLDVPAGMTWDAALAAASAQSFMGLQGHLATITSAEENALIVSQLGGQVVQKWLGGRQAPGSAEPAAGWQWITGEPWGYTNWAPGEPNQFAGSNEDSLHFKWTDTGAAIGQWNDLSGLSTAFSFRVLNGYIVEFEDPGMKIDPQTGLIEWTPGANQTGPNNVTVRVTDKGGLFAEQSFSVTVRATNAPPVAVAGLLNAPGLPSCVAPPGGLVSWYPGDGTPDDIVGISSPDPGSTRGIPDFVAGVVGQAMRFDGNSGYVVPNNPTIDFGANDSFTIDAWVRVDGASGSSGDNAIVDKRNSAGNGYTVDAILPPFAPAGMVRFNSVR